MGGLEEEEEEVEEGEEREKEKEEREEREERGGEYRGEGCLEALGPGQRALCSRRS